MTKPSAFDKNQIQTISIEEKRGFLDELHLPPNVISFIRNNSRSITIVLTTIVLMVFAWIFYNQYMERQNDKAAALLASVLKESEDEKRVAGLESVLQEYSGTVSALWGRLELGHIDFKDGNYEAALNKYKQVLDSISAENSLAPLVVYSVAQTYEQMQNNDQAIVSYQSLTTIVGFEGKGYLGLGRLYEKSNEPVKARETYEKYLQTITSENGEGVPSKESKLIEDKLARLKITDDKSNTVQAEQ